MTDQATKRPLEAIAGNIYQAHSYKPGHLAKVASVYGTDTESAESLSKRLVAAVNAHDGLRAENQRLREALVLAHDYLIGAHLPDNDGGFINNKINAALTDKNT